MSAGDGRFGILVRAWVCDLAHKGFVQYNLAGAKRL